MQKIKELVQEIGALSVEVNASGEYIAFFRLNGHVNTIDVEIASKADYTNKLFQEASVAFEADWFYLDRDRYEKQAITKLTNIKNELQRYLGQNEFQSIWESYQSEIEQEIVDCIRHGFTYTEESLFHDVMIETSGHEISLDCVYQSMKLFKGEATAKKFKQEMYDLIKWLDNTVQANWSEYESEVV